MSAPSIRRQCPQWSRRLTDITGITTGIAADEIAVEIPLAVLTGMVVDPAGDATTGVAGA